MDADDRAGDAADERPSARAAATLLLAILAVAAVLRFHDVGRQSFWDDEISTIHVASYPLSKIWNEIALLDSSPMMFYTVFRPYLLHAPRTEAALRAFSVLLGLAALGAFYLFAGRVAGRAAALAGTFLLAINPFQVYCAQEVRYNTLALLACLASFYFFARLVDEGRWRDLAGYAVATVVAIYTHYFAFFTPLVQFAYVGVLVAREALVLARDRERLTRLGYVAVLTSSFVLQGWALAILALYLAAHRRLARGVVLWLAGLATAAALFLPFVKTFSFQLLRGVPFRESTPPLRAVRDLWIYATIGQSPLRAPVLHGLLERAFDTPRYAPLLLAILAPLALLVVLGFFGWAKGQGRWLAILYLLVPTAATLGLAVAMKAFDPRYALPYLPAVALLAGKGMANLARKSRVALVVALLYVSAVSAASLSDYYNDPRYFRQDWRGAVGRVVEASREGDAVLFYDYYVSLPFLFYFHYERPYYYLFSLRDDLARSLPERRMHLAENMKRFLGKYDRFWLVDYHGFVVDPDDEVRRFLREGGYEQLERDCRYRGLHQWCVDLYTRDLAEVRTRFLAAVDFAKGDFLPAQLRDGWFPGKDAMRWMGRAATVEVRDPGGPREARAAFYAHYPYLGGRPMDVVLKADGVEVARVTVDHDDLYQIAGKLPDARDLTTPRTLTLAAGRTFVPAEVMGGNDRSEKSLLVSWIGIP